MVNARGSGEETRERTEHGQNPHAEVVEHTEFLHVALLELLFGERQKLDVPGDLSGVHDGDA